METLNMTYKIVTSQDTIEFDFKDYKGLAIALSGGIDSATLFYCLAEYITVEKLDIKLYPMTATSKQDVAASHAAGLVVNLIKKRFPNVFVEHIIRYTTLGGNFKKDVVNRIVTELYEKELIQAFIDGVTKNPDSSFNFIPPDEHYSAREEYRESDMPKVIVFPDSQTLFRPFAGINKKGICEITEQKNITKRLLLITRSCSHTRMYRCKKCWWCQERQWGFNIPVEYRWRI
jgi:tRNA(Ile)-lysidine synthase TilS/MesJ